MGITRPHPLDQLVKDDSLFLLEAMIPFVDYSFKKPLIMLIKYQELNAILRCFDNPAYIAECGFDCHPSSSEEMLQSLCNFMPGFGNNIKQMMQMMNMMQMMQTMQGSQEPSSCINQSRNMKDYSQEDYANDWEASSSSGYNQTAGNHAAKNLYDSVLSILDEDDN